jgi:hypothetical protein
VSVPSALGTAWGRFLGFWFTPKDPTTMAFIRIVTGCLVLYVHLVYSFDLTAFFGRDAWYDLKAADRQRWEEPARNPPFEWEHTDLTRSAQVPDQDGARRAVFGWIRGLPGDKDELAAKLRLLDEDGILTGANRPQYGQEGMALAALGYMPKLSPDPAVRANTLKSITGELPRSGTQQVPEMFDRLSAAYLRGVDGRLGGFAVGLPDAAVRSLAAELETIATHQPAGSPKAAALRDLAARLPSRDLSAFPDPPAVVAQRLTAVKAAARDLSAAASRLPAGSSRAGELNGLAGALDRLAGEAERFAAGQQADPPDPADLKAAAGRVGTSTDLSETTKTAVVNVLQNLADDPKTAALKTLALVVFARDLDAFASTLPGGTARADEDRKVVVAYLQFLVPNLRDNLFEFLRDSTADKVPDFERGRRIDYLERWGYEERYVSRSGSPVFSIWFHVTEPGEMRVVHTAVLLVMLMFTLGLFTRVTSVLTWLAAVSYLHRDQQVLFGQDTMMNILLIYLMIANSGAALSLDRVIARYRAARASVARSGGIDAPAAAFLAAPPPSLTSGFAQRLLQVHFCFIYMAAGLSKLKGGSWWSGDAMWYTLMNPEFTMIHWEWYQNLMRWLFSSRPVYSAVAAGGVLFTLFVEIGLPYLVWTRMRPWIVIGGLLLHFGVGVFMGLLVFSLFMMTMLVSYIPGAAIREHLFGAGNGNGQPDGQKKRVIFNPADPKTAHAVATAVALDARGKVEVVRA